MVCLAQGSLQVAVTLFRFVHKRDAFCVAFALGTTSLSVSCGRGTGRQTRNIVSHYISHWLAVAQRQSAVVRGGTQRDHKDQHESHVVLHVTATVAAS